MAGDPQITDNRAQAYETLGIDRRAREQVERYRSQGLDLDGFDYLPFEGGQVFHVNENGDPASRLQAWMQKNETGQWGVVFLDRDTAQHVYETQAQPILQADAPNDAPVSLSWVANRSGVDDREPPEVTSFFMLQDAQGNVWGCKNEHMHLIGPDGQIIEPQGDIYPPEAFDLQSGQLASGYRLQVNADNPPQGMPDGLSDENGMVDPMTANMLIGFLKPDPSDPEKVIRFNPVEEGFAVAYVQENDPEQQAQTEAARLIGQSASFTQDNMEFITVPPSDLRVVSIQVEVSAAEPAPAPDANTPEIAEQLAPLEQARDQTNDRFYNSITERARRGELNGTAPSELEDAEPQTSSTLIAGTQLLAYIDITGIDNGDSYRALLSGEFGGPSDMDKAFVAEKLYEHIILNSSNEEFLTPDRLQVYKNLQEELPQLREAAGYSALAVNTQASTYIFFGEPSRMPDLGEPRLVENHGHGDIAVFEHDVPAGAPGTMSADTLLGQTSYMNDPEFSAAYDVHRQAVEAMELRSREALARGEILDLNEQDLEPLSRPMLPVTLSADPNAPIDFSIQYEQRYPEGIVMVIPVEHEKEHYFDFADMMVEGIVAQEGGREAIIANFLENNDASVFPLTPVLNDEGNNIMTFQWQGAASTFWQDAEGNEISLNAQQLGALMERAFDTESGAEGLQAYLQENPEMETVLQFMAMSIDTIQEVETGNLAPDINYDAPDPNENISPREQHEFNLRVQP